MFICRKYSKAKVPTLLSLMETEKDKKREKQEAEKRSGREDGQAGLPCKPPEVSLCLASQ